MKDIYSLIEKACIEYCEQVDSVYNEKDVFKAGANFILSKWQEANRWRKVSEELPEHSNKVWGVFIYDLGRSLGRSKGQVYYFNEKWWHEPIGGSKIEVDVTEWKPIE